MNISEGSIDPNELKVAKHSVLLIVDGAVIFTA